PLRVRAEISGWVLDVKHAIPMEDRPMHTESLIRPSASGDEVTAGMPTIRAASYRREPADRRRCAIGNDRLRACVKFHQHGPSSRRQAKSVPLGRALSPTPRRGRSSLTMKFLHLGLNARACQLFSR
ncbi:MAG TPA: hypothetical protein VEF89_32955, partial [Solirubrobacteraceae bacterium]|nr:hypothetical protein [Solirubrobacteraceae bacterium]